MTCNEQLHVLSRGHLERAPLVFLHGFLGRGEDWVEVTKPLTSNYRCVFPDLPGHGKSVGYTCLACYSMKGAGDRLWAQLSEMGIEQCTLVGYSMGARLALYLAVHYPERVQGLVLESGSPGLKSSHERKERRKADKYRAEQILSNGLTSFLDGWYAQPLFSTMLDQDGLVERVRESRALNDPVELGRSLAWMGSGAQPSVWGNLPALQGPVLAMAGARDPKFTQIAGEMGGLCKPLQVDIVPDAGHNIHLEQPDEYIQRLESFLEDVYERV